MYKLPIAAALLLSTLGTSAQTLFTYGRDTVTVADFLKAYNKNNTAAGKGATYSLNDYLDLYITSRLKVAEAKALGYDTLPQMKTDLEGLRTQILPTYLTDDAGVNRLVAEAAKRQQKDIRLSHIFIAINRNGIIDEASAQKRAAEAYSRLGKGEPFETIARQFSDDPSAAENGGNIGYITAFSLPYELENLAYGTAPGKLSSLYRSKAGFHIFKNTGERASLGRLKVAQILIATPPEATAAEGAAAKKRTDSLYSALLKGSDFAKLATAYSNDVVSAASGGAVPEFGVGEYDPLFEARAFALKDGEISKPFNTGHGWHIVKRLGRTSITNSDETMTALQAKVENSDRMNSLKEAQVKSIMQRIGYRQLPFAQAGLWAYSDSLLDSKPVIGKSGLTSRTTLAVLGDTSLTVDDWIRYARQFRLKTDGTGPKPYPQLWEEFVQAAAMDYYKANLERYNPEFKAQVAEFSEGNLFFEIMQRTVWGPASADTAALEAYYKANREKYNWKPSADAVVFYAGDAATAAEALKALKAAPLRWKEIAGGFEDRLAADSNRFEMEGLPNPGKVPLKPGTLTAAAVNKADNTASFAYIIRLYPQPAPRSFAEAKGLVINDYQTELENKWVNALRAKYPVTINQPVLLQLMKK
jgi:peptidyl-prolyl cis-trans isomerase SurA